MSLNRATGVCMFCGEDSVQKVCGGCEGGYHIACARERGNLQIDEHGNGVVSSPRVDYDWKCPNCGESVRGTM